MICRLNLPARVSAYMSDGEHIVGVRRSGEGKSYRMSVSSQGMLDITGNGKQPGGPQPFQLVFNGQPFWYEGEGAPEIYIASDGTFSVAGNGNKIEGELISFPRISDHDSNLLQDLKGSDHVPYQNRDPDQHRSYEDCDFNVMYLLQVSPTYYDLGLSIYDWTTPDFFRMTLFNIYRYTKATHQPLSHEDIITGIWTTNMPPYTAQDEHFMRSFKMTPAKNRDEVAEQFKEVGPSLRRVLDGLKNMTISGLGFLPRPSVLSTPKLYSSQIDFHNLPMDAWATFFEEYPGNAGPVGSPMGMPIQEALAGFMKPGSTLTLKTFIGFTDKLEQSMYYSNGVIVEMEPADGSAVWGQSPDVTPLSYDRTKTQYLFLPGSKWSVVSHKTETKEGKDYVVITMKGHVPVYVRDDDW